MLHREIDITVCLGESYVKSVTSLLQREIDVTVCLDRGYRQNVTAKPQNREPTEI